MRKKEFIFQKVFPYILSCSLIMGSVLPVSADASTEINGSISASAIDISASSTANYTINGKNLTSDTIGILNNSNFPISVGVASVDKTVGTISDVLPSDVGDQAAWFNLGRRESNSKIALGLKHTSGDYLEEFASDTVYFKSVQDATDAIPLGAVAASGNANYEIDGFHGLAFSSNVSEQYKITWEIGLYEGTGNNSSSGSDEGNSGADAGDVATYLVDKEETTVLNYSLTENTQTASAFSLDDLLGIHTVSADPVKVPQDEVVNVVGTALITGLKDNTISELYIADYYQDAEGNYYKITGISEGKSDAGTIVGDNLTTIVLSGITEVPNYAFYNNKALTNVVFEEGIEKIGVCSFAGCENLESISLPASITSIQEDSFYNTSTSSITVDENNTVYDSRENCNAIIETASNKLFRGCENTVIPDGISIIGGNAFAGADIQNVLIPSSVTSIETGAFNSCEYLEYVSIPDGVTTIAGSTFYGCTNLKSVSIPDGISSIGANAFSQCPNLENIVIPHSVTSIGASAFVNCSSLKSIIIPDGVTIIADYTFAQCSSLEEISIPDGVTAIGNSAFSQCTGATSLYIGSGVTSISNSAFDYCSGLETITVSEQNSTFDSRNNCNAIIKKLTDVNYMLLRGCKNTVIPDDIKSIGSSAFIGCTGMTSITIPSNIVIRTGAFNDCTDLTTIYYSGTSSGAPWGAPNATVVTE